MSWQRFQTFPSLHVPYPYTLIELETEEKKKIIFWKTTQKLLLMLKVRAFAKV